MDGVTFEDIERDGLERWLAEADLEPTAYSYRPGRAALEAVQEVLGRCVLGGSGVPPGAPLRAHAPGV